MVGFSKNGFTEGAPVDGSREHTLMGLRKADYGRLSSKAKMGVSFL